MPIDSGMYPNVTVGRMAMSRAPEIRIKGSRWLPKGSSVLREFDVVSVFVKPGGRTAHVYIKHHPMEVWQLA